MNGDIYTYEFFDFTILNLMRIDGVVEVGIIIEVSWDMDI